MQRPAAASTSYANHSIRPSLFEFVPLGIDVAPLISAIAHERAVVFVGGGASIPAGLPAWKEFLINCIKRAQTSSDDPGVWNFTKLLLEEQGDLLIAAELLQKGLGEQLKEYIWDEFASAVKPSDIHRAVARLPFSLAITTNYDRLLENAYRHRPSVGTWRDPEALFSAIKNRRFAVFKTHGDVDNGASLVLTKSQYTSLMLANAAFNSCLKTLLSYHTFLFVGYSLRDHDLLSLMDEARLMHGSGFGPHYAILFEDTVDDQFIRFLADSYSIHTILARKPSGFKVFSSQERTRVVADSLKTISGKVALQRYTASPPLRLDDSLFCLADACSAVLEKAITLTGSLRGDVCLVRNEHFQNLFRIAVFSQGITSGMRDHLSSESSIHYESVIGSVFLKRGKEGQFLYIPDVENAAESLRNQGFPDTKYYVCDSSVRSELACAIFSEGRTVGVLNVESEIKGAYSNDHLTVLQLCADEIGSIVAEAERRKTAARSLSPYHDDFKAFNRLMKYSRFLEHLKMRYILWQADHTYGKLIAAWDLDDPKAPSDVTSFSYEFLEQSLAALCVRQQERILVDDVEKELSLPEPRLSGRGVKLFKIHGSLVALPISSQGHLSGVLVAWSDNLPEAKSARFSFAAERIHRMVHLIANDPSVRASKQISHSRSENFLSAINKALQPIDTNRDWTDDNIHDPDFRERVIEALLTTLIHPSVGLKRVRLWVRQTLPALGHWGYGFVPL